MQAIRRILVVIEPGETPSLALNRAKLIAEVTQSHLHLLVCDKKHEHASMLEQLCAELEGDGLKVTSQLAWHDSAHKTIIRVQQAEDCGLVVKQHLPDNPLKKALITPEDWKLLRYCPCPVLMVKTAKPWTDGTVLAAVDVGNEDAAHRALHASIISHGYDIAALANATLQVVTAHPTPMLSAADPTYQLTETIAGRYREQCKVFQDEYSIGDDRLHVVEGPADSLIPNIAHQLNAAVTVIGSVARTGISGALIGNTAEVILDSLESDVLVMKPDDVSAHLVELAAKH